LPLFLFTREITLGFQSGAVFFAFVLLGIFLLGILFSYTRAGWLSLAAAAALYVMFIFKIRFITVAIPAVVLTLFFFAFKNDILYFMAKNKEESSKADIAQHVKSIYNITTDASNLERINRWRSAIRMFGDKPLFGFGPGTYPFKYAPYQASRDITPISTNFGIGGGVHSEYLRALAESGLPGLLTFLALIFIVFYKGIAMIYTSSRKDVKYLSLGIILGLVTYFVHAVLNNYSDMDKIAVPLWGFFRDYRST
jgi:putative inorganic carbon (HCO3(-)) transporter